MNPDHKIERSAHADGDGGWQFVAVLINPAILFGMTKGNQEQIAIGANFIPLLSTVWLILFGHQHLTAQLVAASVLIISGSYIAKKSAL